MKRILFYIVLALQIIILLVLGIQYSLIDNYGATVKLKSSDDQQYYSYYDEADTIHLDFEINKIKDEFWDNTDREVDYNEKVYVLIEADSDSVYQVVRASLNKIKAKSNQFVLAGSYQYHDPQEGIYGVNYGIGEVSKREEFTGLNFNKNMLITLKIAPWGQKRIVDVQEIE